MVPWPWCHFFFVWSSPNSGQENGLILSGETFFLVFNILKFPTSPFQNPTYASAFGITDQRVEAQGIGSVIVLIAGICFQCYE